jgi:soluble lytic murein transglycosylase
VRGINRFDQEGDDLVRKRFLKAFVAMAVLATTPAWAEEKGAAGSGATTKKIAAIQSGAPGRYGRVAGLPSILSNRDMSAYKGAFLLQAKGDWAGADREIARIEDDVLIGSVLAERFLNPAYKVKFAELKSWMEQFGDLAEAEDVYALARRLNPADRTLRVPVKAGQPRPADDGANWEDFTPKSATRDSSKPLKARIRQAAQKGNFVAAERLLDSPAAVTAFNELDYDEMRVVLAANAFAEGRDADVLRHAVPAAERSGLKLPTAHWTSGLAYWRMGKPEQARQHFEKLANSREGSPWLVSAGAFWAARANLIARRPEVVNHWLEIASAYPRTFYGILANRALNQESWFGWEQAPLTDLDVDVLLRVTGGKRALAHLQLGERNRAEDELTRLTERATPALAQSILSLAQYAELPELAVRMGNVVASYDGRFHDAASYPMPKWKPRNGWQIDKALVFAFVRQESGFNPSARSPAGASGLMQLMPATARFITGDKSAHTKLTNPEINLDLGQRYLNHLMKDDLVKNNLFFLAAAYNAGPGNLQRWLQNVDYHNDPLLFIESMPSRETRIFVERVMTNFWIYRQRVGQPSPSLDAVVAGSWPIYDAMDKNVQPQVAKHVKD